MGFLGCNACCVLWQVLRTTDWDLGGTESLVFVNMSSGCAPLFPGSFPSCQHLWLDDIVVLDLTPPYVVEWRFKTASVMQLTLDEPYDPVAVKTPSSYGLTSTDDAAYASLTRPAAIGEETKFAAFSTGSMAAVDAFLVYLRWPTPLQHGRHYTVHVTGLIDEAGNVMIAQNISFVFNEGSSAVADVSVNVTSANATAASNASVLLSGSWVSSGVRVNQAGYLPLAPKVRRSWCVCVYLGWGCAAFP